MDWIANTEIGLDPNKCVIKRLWCTNLRQNCSFVKIILEKLDIFKKLISIFFSKKYINKKLRLLSLVITDSIEKD